MNAANRRQQIEDLCHAALERDAATRAAFVATACEGDEGLRRGVEALLAHAQTAEGFLSRPLEELAAHALTKDKSPLASQPLSAQLLERARPGDQTALESLLERYLRGRRRWAHRRVPRWARTFLDAVDSVQDVLLRTFKRFDRFEPSLKRALQAHLRQAVQERVFDEIRRANRRPQQGTLDSHRVDDRPSPLDEALDRENRDRYRLALQCLSEDERQLLVARLDLGYSYEQVALVTRRPTPDSARVATRRAVMKLAQEMTYVEVAKPDQ